MRCVASLLLLTLVAAAQPPVSEGFLRLREFREALQARFTVFQEREQFDAKPREERMLLTFRKGEKFEGKDLTGKLVVKACLQWADVEQPQPTAPGQRVLDLLPTILRERYAVAVDRRERREASNLLVEALDHEFLPIRRAAIESLKAIYGVPSGFGYDPSFAAKDRAKPIKEWKRHVTKRNS